MRFADFAKLLIQIHFRKKIPARRELDGFEKIIAIAFALQLLGGRFADAAPLLVEADDLASAVGQADEARLKIGRTNLEPAHDVQGRLAPGGLPLQAVTRRRQPCKGGRAR